MTMNELEAKIQQLKEMQALIEEVEQEAEEIKDQLKQYMTEAGTDELRAGAFKVRWTKVVSKRFDSKAFKVAHSGLYDQYSKETETRRFSVA